MKKPEYSLRSDIQVHMSGPLSDPIEFPSGTLIFPFWNEYYVPEHIKEQLKNSYLKGENGDTVIFCIIGIHWVKVLQSNIREIR